MTADDHFPGYQKVLKEVASMLRVPKGDLEHGILAVGFVRSVFTEGWPSGLIELFSDRWNDLKSNYDEFKVRLSANADVSLLQRILEECNH